MSENLEETLSYDQWLDSMVKEYHFSQTRPEMKVNPDLLRFCWDMGHGIEKFKKIEPSDGRIYDRISKDLEKAFPGEKFFSKKNLGYMNSFYNLYSDRMCKPRFQKRQLRYPLPKESKDAMLYIPWGHNKLIMDVCQGDKEKAFFYIEESIKHNWNLNELASNLKSPSEKSLMVFDTESTTMYFDHTGDAVDSDSINSDRYEKYLFENLKKKLKNFLLGYGTGFAFIGENVKIKLRNKSGFIDLLFYNMRVHCYLVIQIKIGFWDDNFTRRLEAYSAKASKQIESNYDDNTCGLGITFTMGNDIWAEYVFGLNTKKKSSYFINGFEAPSGGIFPTKYELMEALI